MTIKAVLFDLGNTLVYSNPEETLQKILEAQGIVKSIDHIKQALIKANKEFDIEKHSHLSAHEFYTKWNLVELKHLGITDKEKAKKLAEEINNQWFKFAKIYVYNDVKKTLKKLRKTGLKLGIITGGYEEDLEKILPKVGLEKNFDITVGVNTVGRRKPHPKVFKYAVKQLGVKPHEAIFVGDSLDADYLGAKKVGMTPILIRREKNKQEVAGVRSITGLEEVLKMLEALEGKGKKV